MSTMAQKFSSGVSSWTWCVGPRMSPPPLPMVPRRRRISARTSSGVPKGSVFCSSMLPQKQQPVAVVALQLGRVHAGRLDRVEHVDADLDELGDDVAHVAVGVIGHLAGSG